MSIYQEMPQSDHSILGVEKARARIPLDLDPLLTIKPTTMTRVLNPPSLPTNMMYCD